MKIIQNIFLIKLTIIVCTSFAQQPALCCIDFSKSTTFPPNTTYNNPNDSITSFCGYESRTDKLIIIGKLYYSLGKLGQTIAGFGSGQIFNTNNVTLRFTAISVAKSVTITFDYLDMGCTENLSINGKLYTGEFNSVPASLGNATIVVTSNAITLPAKGKTGTVTIKGIIKEFKIGGQEFYLDNMCFVNKSKEKNQ